jgi:hypothetical protein
MPYATTCPATITGKFTNTSYKVTTFNTSTPPTATETATAQAAALKSSTAASSYAAKKPTFNTSVFDTINGTSGTSAPNSTFPSVMSGTSGTSSKVTNVSFTPTSPTGVGATQIAAVKIFSLVETLGNSITNLNFTTRYQATPSGTNTYVSIPALTSTQLTAITTYLTNPAAVITSPSTVPSSDQYTTANTGRPQIPGATSPAPIIAADKGISNDLIYSLNFEYCYWGSIYRTLIGDLVDAQSYVNPSLPDSAGGTPSPLVVADTLTTNIAAFINAAIKINQRLQDLAAIANALSTASITATQSNSANIDQTLSNIAATNENLKAQQASLISADSQSILRSRMMSYSDEKNSYATQQLALYGFANFIALGLLFYIYRS